MAATTPQDAAPKSNKTHGTTPGLTPFLLVKSSLGKLGLNVDPSSEFS